jgi:phenylacetate-CoA ligase
MRAQIEQKLGLHAYDIYGLSEICGRGVANTCEYGDLLHIQADHFIAEVVDPETGAPLPDGEIGELVFSSITKQGTPLLRYNTHDLTRLTTGTCACGRTTPRMEKVTGRADDMLIIRGVNVFPTQIEAVLLKFGEVEPHYMINIDRVHNLDVMEIRIEMSPRFFSDSIKEIEHTERKLRDEVASTTGDVGQDHTRGTQVPAPFGGQDSPGTGQPATAVIECYALRKRLLSKSDRGRFPMMREDTRTAYGRRMVNV